ncbi:hypothetical protein [uncultured Clostridium sp.]|uniref:hypothetical protein n=1 Tax=uncultured Clostridium sp. TaxID=59620 RepID=UPI002670D922|nr:hypothetical protein [uncultured Clostridium sp.]
MRIKRTFYVLNYFLDRSIAVFINKQNPPIIELNISSVLNNGVGKNLIFKDKKIDIITIENPMIIKRYPNSDFLFKKIIPTPSNNKIEEAAKLAPLPKEFPKKIGV